METCDPETIGVAAGLVRVSFLVQGIYARAAGRHGLTPAQARLLCILLDAPRGMAELAGLLGVEKAGLTGLVDRVEHRGFVRRTAVPGDRRVLQPTLTPAGRRVAGAFHGEVTGELTALVADMSPVDQERFRCALARIVQVHDVPAVFATVEPGDAATRAGGA
ncbi:MarR family winged helix-turn-helix transcriptional regulator [Protofrankia symbiont of Coriaria ruscifolia]|uniref:HTH marR-type domain-containing protein n=1 Tax=Candidatus Protofrankia californiensis TaxID=1839754 RepID=A0A1C3P2V5_9ACTN|nr:MarR family transcriptional regulator [Protofrankia symbiont of Coriaria ruscifolia]SBW24110.1 hypothetical protein FDG2_4018 [Candidatus Protofrankia californiensis]